MAFMAALVAADSRRLWAIDLFQARPCVILARTSCKPKTRETGEV